MTTPAQVLDEVLAAVTPLLREHGYVKSARYFVASHGGVARVLQFQTRQLKKPEEAAFTLAFIVSSTAFHEAYTGKPFPKNAGSGEPVVQGGLGRLLPDGEDVYWSLTPGVSSALIAGEVSALLADPVLPFLARFGDEDSLLRELESGAALPGFSAMRERCRAVLLARRGRAGEARAILTALREANAGEGLDGFRASIDELLRRLSL